MSEASKGYRYIFHQENNLKVGCHNEEDGWNKVLSKRKNKAKSFNKNCENLNLNEKLKAVKCFWRGFNEEGQQRWFIELNNGVTLSEYNKEYSFWLKKYKLS
jgi:hypothetical protein